MGRFVNMTGLAILVILLLNISPALAVSEMAGVRVDWPPSNPAEGTEAKIYHVWIQFWNPDIAERGFWGEVGTTSSTTFHLECYRGLIYMVKVYAEDEAGALSPASVPSEPLLIPGAELLGASSKTHPPPAGKPTIK